MWKRESDRERERERERHKEKESDILLALQRINRSFRPRFVRIYNLP